MTSECRLFSSTLTHSSQNLRKGNIISLQATAIILVVMFVVLLMLIFIKKRSAVRFVKRMVGK